MGGWRSPAQYRLDREAAGDRALNEAGVDLARPLADWTALLSVVRDAAMPLAALLITMAGQLTGHGRGRAVGRAERRRALERISARIGREAADALRDDAMSAEAVATALGAARSNALVLLLTAQDGQGLPGAERYV
ncbi:hypothetical protein [Streptomyces sp. NPDC054838]